jgi:hypothetical protein
MRKKVRCGSGKPSYEIVENQLSNEFLIRTNQIVKDSVPLFPKEVRLDKWGRLVDPRQFIISGTGPFIDKFTVGKQFWLKPTTAVPGITGRVKVQVIKSNKPSPTGKRYVLLQTTTTGSFIDELEGADEIHVFGEISPNAIGVIHPGESNENGGKSNSGQASCYGASLLVRLRANPVPDPLAEVRTTAQIATYERDAALGTATVAVLDSGIWFDEFVDPRRRTICSDISWDFVSESFIGGDPFPDDDHPGLHGTKICTIIKHTAPGVGILPVKISKPNGTLTLYDALCGLEFARTHGARVVNASWSFMANGTRTKADGPDYPLLLGAIRDLEDSGIIVVAAAGNRNQYPPGANGHIGAGGAPLIYPACYNTQNNVITVTTVVTPDPNPAPQPPRKGKYAVFENYSNAFVDTGTVANAIAPEPTGQFEIPGFLNSYRGSSFATPYVAAKIAQVITVTPGYISKRALLRRLREFHVEADLENEIRDGGSYVKL